MIIYKLLIEEYKADVNVKDNPGIATYLILLQYDPEVIDVTVKKENERFEAARARVARAKRQVSRVERRLLERYSA